MSSFKEVFQNKHAVLPVIHVETRKQTLQNATVAYEAGADGVFLISMSGMDHRNLSLIQKAVREEFSTWFIGVNYWDVPTISVFDKLNPGISGVWADDAVIYDWLNEQIKAEKIKQARIRSGWQGLYFGGVAFKYQRQVENPMLAAKIAKAYMDVVTTSGTRTGSAPDISKIRVMKEAVGDFPLAIASGISPENVREFLPFADAFLVATSLLQTNTENFDPLKVKDLVQAVRGV